MRFLIYLSILVPVVVSTILSDSMPRDSSIAQREASEQRSSLEARDEGTTYMAWATNPSNDKEVEDTRKFLNETVIDKDAFVTHFKARDGTIFVWGGLTLDDAALQKVKAYPNIKDVAIEPQIEEDLAITREEELIAAWHDDQAKVKRAPSDWTKQDPAPKNLALINVEKNANPKDYSAFVYNNHAGDGTFIYIIEAGVSYNVEYASGKKEFPKAFPLQSDGSKAARNPRQKPDEDDSIASKPSHGTRVASIALGQRFGVAKKATLISVKATRKTVDRLDVIDDVYEDIAVVNPGRVKKCVVLMSFNFGTDAAITAAAKKAIEPILGLGVPVVVTSGNGRRTVDQVDKAPAVLYAADFPIIVVGGTDPAGNRGVYSQGGPKVAVHAPGSELDVSNKDGSKAVPQVQGTSYAAPAVAGLLATYLSYPTLPWDSSKTQKSRVAEMRNYLQSEKSSVARGSDPSIRTIWNGIPKSDYDQVIISSLKPSKGWSLSIAMVSQVNSHSGGADVSREWKFYTTKVGKAVGSCGETEGQGLSVETSDKPPANADSDNPPWPGGIFKLEIEGEKCVYRCDGTNPGRLFCPKKEVTCVEDGKRRGEGGTMKCGSRVFFHPVVYCDF